MKIPKILINTVDSLKKMPSIGEKTAQRIVLFLLSSAGDGYIKKLTDNIVSLKKDIKECLICHNYSLKDECEICLDKNRKNTICVVENFIDLMNIERTGVYKGKYHILNGIISPLDDITPDKLNIFDLKKRTETENPEEIILALPSTLEGDATGIYIKNLLSSNQNISKLAVGMPSGTSIEYLDEITINNALNARKKFL